MERLNDEGEWGVILVSIPPELETYRPELLRFFDAMIYKLRRNAHKGKWETLPMSVAIERLRNEGDELSLAIDQGSTMEIMMEAADLANMCLIIANIILEVRPDK